MNRYIATDQVYEQKKDFEETNGDRQKDTEIDSTDANEWMKSENVIIDNDNAEEGNPDAP